jgi:hypothetical protein
MIEMIGGFLILCAVIAVAITVVRSMLNNTQGWVTSVGVVGVLFLVGMVLLYGVMKWNAG